MRPLKPDHSRSTTSSGYTLIESIFCIGLIGLVSAACAILVGRTSSVLGVTTRAVEQRLAITKAALVISASLSSLERTHLNNLIQITSGLNPLSVHGLAHPVSGLSNTSRPRVDSDVVSSIEVNPLYRGRIKNTSYSNGEINLEVCEGDALPARDQFRSHIALGLNGICQITGTPTISTSGCFTIAGRAVTGLLNSSHSCQGGALLEYLPVIREYSVFVDRSGELRLISHVGLRILENQPITRGLLGIKIVSQVTPSGGAIYHTEIRAPNTRTHSFIFPAALTRSSLWNEVLL